MRATAGLHSPPEVGKLGFVASVKVFGQGKARSPAVKPRRRVAEGALRGDGTTGDLVEAALRQRLVAFFVSYGARVRIVYLEAPFADLLERNAGRARPVPEPVIRRLAARLDVPDLTEAHALEWVIASPTRRG